MTTKLIVSWIFGGVLIAAAAWILGHVEQTVGVAPLGYMTAIVLAIVMILVGGFMWISVATATSKH